MIESYNSEEISPLAPKSWIRGHRTLDEAMSKIRKVETGAFAMSLEQVRRRALLNQEPEKSSSGGRGVAADM